MFDFYMVKYQRFKNNSYFPGVKVALKFQKNKQFSFIVVMLNK